ncbi:MAG: ATP-NAD kinase family protein, partial [Spirochaetota bacterium]|nr:ATP-NAD kinase family protein [Spirochaetota bacterium]
MNRQTTKKIGLIVNPVAGMGGSVGLKGTDGEAYSKALKLGAQPVTPGRTKDLFKHIKRKEEIYLFTAPGKMGEEYIHSFGISHELIGKAEEETSSENTIKIASEMIKKGIELLIFVGGDGTARDICNAVGLKIPVVAVPSGVKVFSAVFAYSPRAAAEMVDAFIEGSNSTEEEVLDIDETAFRENKLASQLYGYLLVPNVKKFLQGSKECSNTSVPTVESKKRIAAYILENMDKNTLYLLGPGTTLKTITDTFEVQKTLLGVDAMSDGKIIGADVNEQGILSLLQEYKIIKIIITPIGGNGFIFGRGSKQFTPDVIKRVGRENIIV